MEPDSADPPRRLPEGFDVFDPWPDLDYQAVHDAIAWEQKTFRSPSGGSIPLPRLIAMYGSEYRYSGIHHAARPPPGLLVQIADRLEAKTGVRFNSVLCSLYRTGSDSVSWHSDDDYHFTRPDIASVSLGATRTFRIRNKADHQVKYSIDLEHGSVLLMSGRAQDDWQHMIPKTSKPVGPRINLTYRCIRS